MVNYPDSAISVAYGKGLNFYSAKPYTGKDGKEWIKMTGRWSKSLNSDELYSWSTTFLGALYKVYPSNSYSVKGNKFPPFSKCIVWHKAKVLEKPSLEEIVRIYFDRIGGEIDARSKEYPKLAECINKAGF